MRGISNPTKSDFIHEVDLTVKRLHPQSGFHSMVHRQSPTEFSVSPFGDKTRACLRFAKIHSKANRKFDFCYSESLAYARGHITREAHITFA